MTPRRAQALACVVALVAGAGAFSVPALAASRPPAPVNWGLSPTRTEIKAGTHTEVIRVQDRGTTPLHFMDYLRAAHQNRDGQWIFTKAGPASGASWVTVKPRAFTLKPRQVKSIKLTFTIPARAAGSGQRYFGLVVRPVSTAHFKGSGAITSGGIASEIILDVPGKVITSTSYALSAPKWSTGGTIPIEATVRNAGTSYALLNGLAAKSGSDKIPFPGVLVLGKSVRTVSSEWATHPLICLPCHVQLGAASAAVYIVPVYPLIGALLIVAVLVALLIIRRGRAHHRMTGGGGDSISGPPSGGVAASSGPGDLTGEIMGQGEPWINDVLRQRGPRDGAAFSHPELPPFLGGRRETEA